MEYWTSSDRTRRLVLVFDGIDRQKDAPPTLLPALARLGEVVSFLYCAVKYLLMSLDFRS